MAAATTSINTIDPRDVGTPDDWIPRHPEMVRLTGKHPFNAESPLSLLMDQGFITPVPLHYVRNHGPVPKLHWDTHRLVVDG
ncbi:19776_t:CDS:1, partial [Racocetra fulgida]